MITSRQNAAVKRARALAHGKDVSTSAVMLVEGVRLIEDSLTEGIRYDTVLVSPRLEGTERGAALRERLLRSGNTLLEATDDVLQAISDIAADQGVAGLAYKRAWKLKNMLPAGRAALVAVVWGVQDPGNLGTIIRTADAAGATGVIAAFRSACPCNTKCIRATMGSIFRLPVIEVNAEEAPLRELSTQVLHELRQHGVILVGTSVASGIKHTEVDFRRPVAIVLGGEGAGVPEAVQDLCALSVRIPIRREVESLNVASAAAVLLYEAARQRDFGGLV